MPPVLYWTIIRLSRERLSNSVYALTAFITSWSFSSLKHEFVSVRDAYPTELSNWRSVNLNLNYFFVENQEQEALPSYL
jgi:hypothetical protein